MKNYYAILNVSSTATDDEIKRSYRVLAKKYHPDVNPGDATAAAKFAEVNEAHSILSDPQKRAEYDAQQQAAAREEMMARQRAQAQAQAQAQNMQAQVNAIKNQAYQTGHDAGFAEGKVSAGKEISKLEAEIRTLKADNARLSDKLKDAEADRSELEHELFERDRELSCEHLRTKELEDRIKELNELVEEFRQQADEATAMARDTAERDSAELDSTRELIDQTQEKVKTMEQEWKHSDLKHKAQIQLQMDKQKQLREEADVMQKRIAELEAEVAELRAENSQWQQYAKSEQFLSDAEKRLQEWDNKQKSDKKLAKPTLYGTLGVLIWATDDELEAAYAKLIKRYDGKPDKDYTAKLEKIQSAYDVLSDPDKRREYNATIGISDERIAEERQAILDNNKIEEEYRNQLETKEFWARFDEMMFSAQTGDADSQNTIGEMYYYGDEIEQDLEQAVYWFKEAAKQKHAEAMFNLGVCFVNGEGVEKNKTTGLGFIRQAAKLGSKAAQQYPTK